jgi:hypothetical protein
MGRGGAETVDPERLLYGPKISLFRPQSEGLLLGWEEVRSQLEDTVIEHPTFVTDQDGIGHLISPIAASDSLNCFRVYSQNGEGSFDGAVAPYQVPGKFDLSFPIKPISTGPGGQGAILWKESNGPLQVSTFDGQSIGTARLNGALNAELCVSSQGLRCYSVSEKNGFQTLRRSAISSQGIDEDTDLFLVEGGGFEPQITVAEGENDPGAFAAVLGSSGRPTLMVSIDGEKIIHQEKLLDEPKDLQMIIGADGRGAVKYRDKSGTTVISLTREGRGRALRISRRARPVDMALDGDRVILAWGGEDQSELELRSMSLQNHDQIMEKRLNRVTSKPQFIRRPDGGLEILTQEPSEEGDPIGSLTLYSTLVDDELEVSQRAAIDQIRVGVERIQVLGSNPKTGQLLWSHQLQNRWHQPGVPSGSGVGTAVGKVGTRIKSRRRKTS